MRKLLLPLLFINSTGQAAPLLEKVVSGYHITESCVIHDTNKVVVTNNITAEIYAGIGTPSLRIDSYPLKTSQSFSISLSKPEISKVLEAMYINDTISDFNSGDSANITREIKSVDFYGVQYYDPPSTSATYTAYYKGKGITILSWVKNGLSDDPYNTYGYSLAKLLDLVCPNGKNFQIK